MVVPLLEEFGNLRLRKPAGAMPGGDAVELPLAGKIADDLRCHLVGLVHKVKAADDGIDLRVDLRGDGKDFFNARM